MTAPEIVIIIVLVFFVLTVFGWKFYKTFIKKESSECSCCKHNMRHALKKAKKALDKRNLNIL